MKPGHCYDCADPKCTGPVAAPDETGRLREAVDEALRILRAHGLDVSESKVIALAGYGPADLERAQAARARLVAAIRGPAPR